MKTYTPEQLKILQQYKELNAKELKFLKIKAKYESENKIEFWTPPPIGWKPDKNKLSHYHNPAQAKLIKAWTQRHHDTYTFTGGNRCLGAEVEIYDPIKKTKIPISQIRGDFHVLAWNGRKLIPAKAKAPFCKYPIEAMFEVKLSTGHSFVASGGHQVLTPSGYCAISQLRPGCEVFQPQTNLGAFPSTQPLNGQNFFQKAEDFQCDYPADSCLDDVQPRQVQDNDQYVVPLLNDAGEHIFSVVFGHVGDLGNKPIHILLYQQFSLLSIQGVLSQGVAPFFGFLYYAFCKDGKRVDSRSQFVPQPIYEFFSQLQPNAESSQLASHVFYNDCSRDPFLKSSSQEKIGFIPTSIIVSITHVRNDVKWDFTVPEFHNYYTEGVIHHNSGKTTLSAVIAISSLLGYWPWDKSKTPLNDVPCKVLILGQKWEDHIAKTVVPKLWEWWPKKIPVKTRKNQYTDYVWTLKNGSVLHIASNRQEVDTFEGADYDVFLPDEPPKELNYDAITRGLIDRGGRTLLTATILKEPWVDRKIIRAKNEDGTPDRTVFNVHTTMDGNVGYGLLKKEVDKYKWRNRDNSELLQARVEGIPAYMQGLVLPPFKREIHLKSRFPIPTDWLVDLEIDVHPRERQAVLFIATNPRNERYLCDEIWMHGDGTAVGHAIVRRILQHGYLRVNYIEIDPLAKSDSNNEDTTRGKIDKVLRKFALNNKWFNPRPPTNTSYDEGIFCVGIATKDKDSGILSIKEHLKGANNEPSLWIFDDLIRTIYEIEGWMYDKDTQKPQKCIIGSTIIDTPMGQFQIKDLVGKELYVYSYSNKLGRLNVSKAKNIRKIRKKAEIWKLTMDRGVLFATPDHLIMLRNGCYKQLCDLKPYDSLMPLYRNISMDGYMRINPNDYRKSDKYPSEQRFVYECVHGAIPKNMQVHHKDLNYLNHDPNNLELKTAAEHQLLHINQKIAKVICVMCGQEFAQSTPWQKHCSPKCRQIHGDSRRKKLNKTIECQVCGKEVQKVAGQKYCSISCRSKSFRERRKTLPSYNHKVVSVGFYGYEDVFDMTVENDHNFVANGVVVHNCDDHMMECWYRAMLLKTMWYEPDEAEDEDYRPPKSTTRTWATGGSTGY